MRSTPESWRGDLIWWLAIAAAMGTAFWIGNGPRAGLIAGGWMLLVTAVVGFGRRWSDAIRIVGGAGDERNRDLYTRATAVGGSVLAIVIPGWWLVARAAAEPRSLVPDPASVRGALVERAFGSARRRPSPPGSTVTSRLHPMPRLAVTARRNGWTVRGGYVT